MKNETSMYVSDLTMESIDDKRTGAFQIVLTRNNDGREAQAHPIEATLNKNIAYIYLEVMANNIKYINRFSCTVINKFIEISGHVYDGSTTY